jgi:acetyltransferase-like isoleucine patch superfamily enzyme
LDFDAYTFHAPSGSFIAHDFVHGSGFEHGLQCIIDRDVVIGDDVKLGHRVHLASGTRVLNDVEIADDCVTTGISLLGNHVRIRTGSCVSKSVIVDDWCFIAAGIMSSHTKNVYHGRPRAPKSQLVTRYGYGSIIGSRTNSSAGVTVAPGAIVGYGSQVVVDLTTPHGIYYNNPHPYATLQSTLAPDNPFYIEVPDDYVPREFDPELLRKYLPYAVTDPGAAPKQ